MLAKKLIKSFKLTNRFTLLSTLVFANLWLEFIGAGLLAYIISILIDPSDPIFYSDLQPSWYQVLGLLVCKTIAGSYTIYAINHHIYSSMSEISIGILNEVTSNRDFKTDIDSSVLIQTSITECNHIGVGYIMSITNLISEIFLTLAFSIVAIYLIGFPFLYLLIFFLLIGIIYIRALRDFLSSMGAKRIKFEKRRISFLKFVSYGMREIFAYKIAGNIVEKYAMVTFRSNNIASIQQTIKYIQKIWIELLGIIILLIFAELGGESVGDYLPVLAVYAYKVIPSLNRVTTYYNNIYYYKASLKKILSYVSNPTN